MYSIEEVNFKDSVEIKKLLMNSKSIAINNGKLLQEILMHIENKDSVAMKITRDGKILGVWLSKEFEKHISLSYFYVAEEIRRKSIVIEFFMKCAVFLNMDKPIIITTKDTTGFDRYVEKINDTQYLFKGFR